MDAGFTAVDLSLGASLSLLPLWIDDFAAGVTFRASAGSSIIDDSTLMFTLGFFDSAPMTISAGYGPYAYADVPDIYLYGPAVVLAFETGGTLMEIGMIGPSVFLGLGFVL